nr:hypothetical protein [uncultured Flavobacterium sp.]
MYIDNQKIIEFPISNAVPFNQDFFIIINYAIEENFGGTIASDFTS